MAQVEPPPPASRWGGLGVAVGALLGLVVSLFVTGLVFGVAQLIIGTCAGAVAFGAVGFLATTALALGAWYSVARLRGGGFGLGLVRGLLFTVTLYMLVPWPCSLAWGGVYAATGACSHQ